MTVKSLDFEYQETDTPMIIFYRPGVAALDKALGNEGKLYVWEDIAIQPWIENANNPEFLDIVPRAEGMVHYRTSGEVAKPITASGFCKYIHEEQDQGPINERGLRESLSANVRQDMQKFLFKESGDYTNVATRLHEFLESEGLDPHLLTGIGVEDIEGGDAVTYITKDGTATIGLHKDFYTKGAKERFGTDDPKALEAYKLYALVHELIHAHGVMKEKSVGKLEAEFFEQLAKEHKGTKEGDLYAALAEEARQYAKQFTWYNRLAEDICSDIEAKLSSSEIESLVEEYAQEAYLEGHRTEEGIKNYVANKLEAKSKEADEEETIDDKVDDEGAEVVDMEENDPDDAGDGEASEEAA